MVTPDSGEKERWEEIAEKVADDVFQMFSGILHRIVERIETGLTDAIASECSSVKFEDVLDPILTAIAESHQSETEQPEPALSNAIATCSCSHTNLDHTEDGCEISGCGCSGFDFKFWGVTTKTYPKAAWTAEEVSERIKEPSEHSTGETQIAPPENPVEMPTGLDFRNGGQSCDMLSGPCSCGAWHHFKDLPWRIFNQLKAQPTDAGAALLSKESEVASMKQVARAVLILARELALELQSQCSDRIHRDQVKEIDEKLAALSSPVPTEAIKL